MSEVINKVLEYTELSPAEFARQIGLKRPQALYDIIHGKTMNISNSMANKIISVFPVFSKSWLMTGEGDMLKNSEDSKYLLNSDKEFNTTVVLPISAWKVIQAQVESLSVRDRQIDELIKLLKSQMEENRKNDVRTDNATCADAG